MNNDALLSVFEYVSNNSEYVNSVHNFYRHTLDATSGEKWCITKCAEFSVSGLGRVLAKIISSFQKEEYEYCEMNTSLAIIRKKGITVPRDNIHSINGGMDFIILAIGRTDKVSFYTFDNAFYAAHCGDIHEYPFQYIKEFIDEVIKFRIKYGIMEIADYGLDFLAIEFIKAREESLGVNGDQRIRKSSQ